MSQLRLGKEVNKTPNAVIEEAISFFGKDGEGLPVIRLDDTTVYFATAVGHVQVTAVPTDDPNNGTDIDVQAREYEHSARRFIKEI